MGTKINLEQDSPDWHLFRSKRIGASDVPILMGVSPYKTAYQLWLEKTGKVKSPPMNSAMARGKTLEPVARQMVEELFKDRFPACVLVHDEIDYLIASLDGLSHDSNRILEIKACSRNEHNALTVSGVPEKYVHQVQTQLLVSAATECLFTTIVRNGDGENEINYIRVLPDKKIHAEIIEKVKWFKHCIDHDIAPEATAADYELRTDTAWESAAREYKMAEADLGAAKHAHELARERLLRLARQPKSRGYGVTVTKYMCDGQIDWRSIPLPTDVDVEKYRKPATERIIVSVED